jgi:V/A-type H+-transporting ATPase subunit F
MFGFIIGDSSMVTGFRLVGIGGVETHSAEETKSALEKALTRNDLAVVIVSEEFSNQPQIQQVIAKARRERVTPLIVEVPPTRGKPSEKKMSDLVAKTLGVRM